MTRKIDADFDFDDKASFIIWAQLVRDAVNEYVEYNRVGTGTPLNVVVAPLGAVYHNKSGGASTSFYVKEAETTTPDSTGWVAK